MPSCLGDEEIARLQAGRMTEEEAAWAEAHLRTCAACLARSQARSTPQPPPAGAAPPGAAVPAPAEPDTGAARFSVEIPGYQLVREIHRGGQGVVFEARQLATRRTVAIKLVLEGALASTAAKRRFDREVQLISQLKHPSIITIFDTGVASNGCRYYVMEHIRGRPIHEYVRSHDLSVREVLGLMATVGRGIHHAHRCGVVHRDLKPSNILMEAPQLASSPGVPPGGAPRILDFGLAKSMDGPPETVVTLTGQVFGTLPYMSPEQVGGKPDEIDARSDVFALGVITYELLTGGYPYPVDGQIGDVIRQIRETEPTPPSRAWLAARVAPSADGPRRRRSACPIDDEVQTILLQCLAKEPRARYQSAADLADDIDRYLRGEPILAKRRSTFYRVRKSLPRHKLAMALVALAAVAGLSAWAVTGLRARLREQRQQQRADLLDQMQQAILLMNADALADLTNRWRQAGFEPTEYEAYCGWLSMLHLDDQQAMQHADRALQLTPECALAHYLRACVHAYQLNWPEAAVDFGRAQQFASDGLVEQGLRGMLKGLLGQYDASIEDLDRLVERQRGSAAALWVRGCSRWFHLLRDPPADLDARWTLGQEARDDMDAAAKLYPSVPFVYDARADLLRRLAYTARARGDPRAADDLLQDQRRDGEKLIRLGPAGAGHNILSAVAFDQQRWEEALEHADLAYELLTAPSAPAAVNREDALRSAMLLRIWSRWMLREEAAAGQLAAQLAQRHPEGCDPFSVGFFQAVAVDRSTPQGERTRAQLLADETDLGSPAETYGLGLWAGAKHRGDEELASRVARRMSVGLLDRARWSGAWLRFLQGEASPASLLRAAGEDVPRMQFARLTLAIAAAPGPAFEQQLSELSRLAYPSAAHVWSQGLNRKAAGTMPDRSPSSPGGGEHGPPSSRPALDNQQR